MPRPASASRSFAFSVLLMRCALPRLAAGRVIKAAAPPIAGRLTRDEGRGSRRSNELGDMDLKPTGARQAASTNRSPASAARQRRELRQREEIASSRASTCAWALWRCAGALEAGRERALCYACISTAIAAPASMAKHSRIATVVHCVGGNSSDGMDTSQYRTITGLALTGVGYSHCFVVGWAPPRLLHPPAALGPQRAGARRRSHRRATATDGVRGDRSVMDSRGMQFTP